MVSLSIRNVSVLAFVWTCLSALGNFQTTAAVSGIEQGGTRLYTDYVAYCSEAKAVLVNQFDIAYFKANHSVVFQISAASVEPNLNISANIYAVAYGMQLLNYTVNLCDYLEGVLCPLPQINFTGKSLSMRCTEEESNVCSVLIGFGTLPIPEDVLGDIPSLAWSVPNLEAYAQVTLNNVDTNEVAACLTATLSNGWSVQRTEVKWIAAAVVILALLAGFIHSTFRWSPSPAVYRWYDILYTLQWAVAVGLLNLNYPSVYNNFALNFPWAMGLFHNSNIEQAINNMRGSTGAELTDEAYGSTVYVNRKLSPYNAFRSLNLNRYFRSDSTVNDFTTFMVDVGRTGSNTSLASDFMKRATIPTVDTNNASAQIEPGIPVYVNSLNIPTANAFDTIFIIYLIAILVVLGIHMIWFALVFVVDRSRSVERRGTGWIGHNRRGFWGFFGGNMLRLGSVGMIYRQYRQKYHFWWFAPMALATFVQAAFIGFGRNNRWAQVIGLMVVEFIVLVCLLGFRPHKDRKGDWLAPVLSFLRLASFGLLIAFIPSVGVKPIPRTVIGFVILAVYGIPFVLLFFGLLFNLFYGYLFRRHKRRVEDGTEVYSTTISDDHSSQTPAMMGTGTPITTKPSGYSSPASYPTEASGSKPPSDSPTYPSGSHQDPYGRPAEPVNEYQPPINGTGQQQYYYPNGFSGQYQERAY
ncbi:hypothetical protein QFC20_001440 [Naganishia adeliensis]|uniref:Uncharacterized protein n=1 Tax=Naganishia adeliensis TaxID=92952 RepID=A0ACC2WUR8_9TREE|nr:hypothetical protein QFC20_001440 [Naganishia adeliensis]